MDTLLKRAYSRPEMRGRYAGRADLRCALYGTAAWERVVHFKQSTGNPGRASFIIRSRLETDRPQAPVEEVTLTLADLTGESGVQMGLLPDVREGRERRLVEVERQLQSRTGGVSVLHRVTEVAPRHPAPEMRSVQVPVDSRGREGLRPISTPVATEVRGGPDGRARRSARRQSLAQGRLRGGHLEFRSVVDAAPPHPHLLPGEPGGRPG